MVKNDEPVKKSYPITVEVSSTTPEPYSFWANFWQEYEWRFLGQGPFVVLPKTREMLEAVMPCNGVFRGELGDHTARLIAQQHEGYAFRVCHRLNGIPPRGNDYSEFVNALEALMPNDRDFQKPEVLEQAKKDIAILRGEEKHLKRIRIFKDAIEGNLTEVPDWDDNKQPHETFYETAMGSEHIRLRLSPGPSFACNNFKISDKALIAMVRLDSLDRKLSKKAKASLAESTIKYLQSQGMGGKYYPEPWDDGEEEREGGVLHMWYQHPSGYVRSGELKELEAQGKLLLPTDEMLQRFLPVLQRATEGIARVKKKSEDSYSKYFEEPATAAS